MLDGVHVVDDVGKLSGLDLDVVYVTTPIFSHSFVTKNVYSRGIARNVFVEKTLGSSYEEAKGLCELAQNFRGINMVGYMKRFAVTFRKAKELLDQETLGEVASFEVYGYSSDFFGINKNSKASSSRGGVLGDSGCHAVDLALWFFGDLQVDSAQLASLSNGNSEDSAYFTVKTSSALVGEFSISWCMENYRLPEFGLVIKGSKGIMRVNDDELELKLDGGKSFTWYRHDLNDNVFFWLGAPEYVREDEYFIKSVLESSNAEPSFYTASKVDYIIDQIRCRAGKDE